MTEENHDADARSDAAGKKPVPARTVKEPGGQSNLFYGCAILLIAATTFGFIITWTIYSGLKQNSEINAFTSTDAPPLDPIKVDESQKSAVRTKLSAFATVANLAKPVTLTLTTEELNTMIVLAGDAGVADY